MRVSCSVWITLAAEIDYGHDSAVTRVILSRVPPHRVPMLVSNALSKSEIKLELQGIVTWITPWLFVRNEGHVLHTENVFLMLSVIHT